MQFYEDSIGARAEITIADLNRALGLELPTDRFAIELSADRFIEHPFQPGDC